MSRQNRGVTLLELMVVLACVGILAAIAVPSWIRNGWPAYRLKNAANQVVADVRYARMRAVAASREYRLRFDAAADLYLLEKGAPPGGVPSWTPEGPVRRFGENGGTSFSGVDITGDEEYSIVFGPTGAVTPRTVTLESTPDRILKVICSMAGRIRVARE